MSVIIYPPTIDWEYMRQRPQNLMLEFAKNGHQVFYCNKKQLAYPYFEKLADNLHVIHNVELFTEKFVPRIKKENIPIVVWCSWAMLANTVKKFQPDAIIYDCLDEFVDWLPYEPEMVHTAELIFCSSDRLMRRLTSHYPGKKIFLLNNACDFKRFNDKAVLQSEYKPPDLPETGGARIGYIGAWAWWVDVKLVRKICQSFPEHQIVVIGPDLGAPLLKDSPNFIYLGLKKYEELPEYLSNMDICIIPFEINETTMATNPIKAYEYLAAGKTVIATALPELTKMQPQVKIGISHEDFIKQIKESLHSAHKNIMEKIMFAQDNSWENRYLFIDNVLNSEIPLYFKENTEPFPMETIEGLAEEDFNYFWPVADATITSVMPEENCDFEPILVGKLDNGIYRYLIKFNPREIHGEIKKACLSIFLDRCEDPEKTKCIEVKKIIERWDETLVTWCTRPKTEPIPVQIKQFDNIIGWLELEITALVKDWVINPESNFGILLKGRKQDLPFLIRGINRHRYDYYSPKLKIYF